MIQESKNHILRLSGFLKSIPKTNKIYTKVHQEDLLKQVPVQAHVEREDLGNYRDEFDEGYVIPKTEGCKEELRSLNWSEINQGMHTGILLNLTKELVCIAFSSDRQQAIFYTSDPSLLKGLNYDKKKQKTKDLTRKILGTK